MDYDLTMIRGDADKPAVVFVHGLGMDKNIWVSPDESRILGGSIPVGLLVAPEPELQLKGTGERGEARRISFGEIPRNLTTLFHDFRNCGYTVIAWSQKRPSAEIEVAVAELREILSLFGKYCRSGIILIGHSRGGLVARAYLKEGDERVSALVTLATPHKGSEMAQWARHLTPLISVVNPLLSGSEKGTLKHTVERIFDFLQSTAVREILPDSQFFRTLDDRKIEGVYYLSAGGDAPSLFSVYRRVADRAQDDNRKKCIARTQKVFSVPDVLEKILPERVFPDEMKPGRGDGLVSVKSSKIQWADEHHVFEVNHAGILFNGRVRMRVMESLKKLG